MLTSAHSVLMLIALGQAPIEESYFVVIFSAQRPLVNQPRHAHNWATFIRVHGSMGPHARVDSHTVSWMPATSIIRPARLFAEEGDNLDLQRTLAWARRECLRVSILGPYQIDKCLFERSLDKVRQLESGSVRYKAVDFGRDSNKVSNCTHALTTIAPESRLRFLQPGWGDSAGRYVRMTYRPNMLDRTPADAWLLDVLGVADLPVTFRR